MIPSQLVGALECAFASGQVPFIWGDSGIGKSQLIAQFAAADNRELRDVRAVQLDPVDLRGLPVPDVANGVTKWLPPEFLPKSGRGILFFDELPSAPQLVQAAMYQLVLDRAIGEFRLGPEWLVVAAGNPAKAKGVHFAMPYPLRARFAHLTLVPDVDDWCRWALANDIDPMIIAFLRCRPQLLNEQPVGDVYAWGQPRSWASASRHYRAAKARGLVDTPVFSEMQAGTVGQAAATEFGAFLSMARRLPSPEAILLNPDTTTVPDEPDGRMAVASALGRLISPANISSAVTYLKRIRDNGRTHAEFLTLALRDAAARDERITMTREFTEFAVENQGALV